MNVAVVGTGAWGQAFAAALVRNGHEVSLVARNDSAVPRTADIIFVAVPAQAVRERLTGLDLPVVPLISLAKGIEITSGLRVTQVMAEVCPGRPVGAVSGPGLASEVAAGKPTALVVAANSPEVAEAVQRLMHSTVLRTYRSGDLAGVEYGGALKNIFAISAGVCHGLRIGENAMAGLVTRSLAEMVRLAVHGGAKMETMFGLSGVGDLMLTAYSSTSRNHRVGVGLAEGRGLDEILQSLGGVAEGVFTCKAIHAFAAERGIKAPIVGETYRVLFEGKSPTAAIRDLLTREVYVE
ncbi:MAG: NAD(P)H-dependent glycerol-3-phosphate dehydrogenase [Candidatus Methylacidiphilales bacterium]